MGSINVGSVGQSLAQINPDRHRLSNPFPIGIKKKLDNESGRVVFPRWSIFQYFGFDRGLPGYGFHSTQSNKSAVTQIFEGQQPQQNREAAGRRWFNQA